MMSNRREKLLLGVTVTVIALLLLDSVWLGPLLDRWDAVDKSHAAARLKLDKLRSTADSKPRQQRALRDIEAELRALASSSAVLEFDRHLSDLAEKAGAETREVRYVRSEKIDVYEQVVYALNLDADIGALRKYLYALDTSDLPLKVSNLTITRNSRGSKLKVSMTVSTLSLRDESERRG